MPKALVCLMRSICPLGVDNVLSRRAIAGWPPGHNTYLTQAFLPCPCSVLRSSLRTITQPFQAVHINFVLIVLMNPLQVDPATVLHALTTRTLEMRGESIVKNLDAAAATESRDALAKSLYATLFDWLVAAINRKIPSYGAAISVVAGADVNAEY